MNIIKAGVAAFAVSTVSAQHVRKGDEFFKSPAKIDLTGGSRELDGNEDLYPLCRADISSDMSGFYDNLYIPMELEIKSEFDIFLSDSGVTTSEDKLNLILKFCIDNPTAVNQPTSEASFEYLQSGELAGFKCIDSTLTSAPSTLPTVAPSVQVIDRVVDCDSFTADEKSRCLLVNSLVKVNNKASESYGISFGLSSGSFEHVFNELAIHPVEMMMTYDKFDSLVPAFTGISGEAVFNSLSEGCQIKASNLLDLGIGLNYSYLDQFMSQCSSSIKEKVTEIKNIDYMRMQQLESLLKQNVTNTSIIKSTTDFKSDAHESNVIEIIMASVLGMVVLALLVKAGMGVCSTYRKSESTEVPAQPTTNQLVTI